MGKVGSVDEIDMWMVNEWSGRIRGVLMKGMSWGKGGLVVVGIE